MKETRPTAQLHITLESLHQLQIQGRQSSHNDIGNGVSELKVLPPFQKNVISYQTTISNIEQAYQETTQS